MELIKLLKPIKSFALPALSIIILYALRHFSGADIPPEEHIDTYIPHNHVLVPIEIKNAKTLSAFTGSTLTADLYAQSNLILKNVRIIRSPKNHKVYAALVKDQEARKIIHDQGPFSIRLRHPKSKLRSTRSRVQYAN